MYPQSSSQSPVGTETKPSTCYNCGACDHFMMACPEQVRQIPAGLAAARAAQAAQSSEAADNGQYGYGHRPFKRQKTGPIVTRFPAPPTGPVVTHYAPPPTQAPPYTANINDSYYGPPPTAPYQQQPLIQGQPYAPHVPPQPGMHYLPYAAPQPPNIPQGFVQPTMPTGPQGYGQLAPNMPQAYGRPTTQPMPQYDYQNSHGVPFQEGYATAPMPQQYGYDSSIQYGQPQMAGQPSQNCPPYQGQPPFHGQPTTPYTSYQGLPPAQSYGQSTPVQDQNGMQNWGQPPTVHQAYPAPAYQPGNPQYQKPYQNQYRKRPYQHPTYQASQFGRQGTSQTTAQPTPGPSAPQHGYGTSTNPQQFQKYPGRPRSFGVSSSQPGSTAPPSQPLIVEEANEEADFQWNLEKIFAKDAKKDADPIGRPLPTVYDEEPILPPAYNAKAIIGKYVRPNNLEIFARDIRLSLHWPSLKADPVFNDIDFDSPLIPLDDIESWIRQRQSRLESAELIENSGQSSPVLNRAPSEEQDNSSKKIFRDALHEPDISRSYQALQGSMDGASDLARPARDVTPAVDRSTTPAFERSGTPSFGADDDAWAPQPGEGQITTSLVTDPTEALLASLGVTGSPKPIAPKNPGFTSPVYMDDLSQDFYNRVPIRQDSGYASQRGSISHESRNTADNATPYSEYRQSYNGTNPPPPPPPPPHMRRQVDGALDSPSSDGSGQFRIGAGASRHDVQSNGAQQGSSPLTPTSAEGIAHEYAVPHELKVVKKPAPQRQVDDVTPKLKRRQPKVADAYSRRW